MCNPGTGTCQSLICEAGEAKCTGVFSYAVCVEPGFWKTGSEDCPDDQICDQGACKVCRPNEPYCAGPATIGICNATGDGPSTTAACLPTQGCHEFDHECAERICEPGSLGCRTAVTLHRCLPSGAAYDLDGSPCEPDQLCVDSWCVYRPCVPTVMLLVDASGSMDAHWGAVRDSVHELLEANPDTIFGLMTFPASGWECVVNPYPPIPLDYYSPDRLDDWFDKNSPSGPTPLHEALRLVVSSGGAAFGGYGGSLVVLSDGADTCYEGQDLIGSLESLTATLHSAYKIRTYVIGYAYNGNPAQLNAIARNGGTQHQNHIPAGNETDLVDAFQAIVDDFKLCTSGSGR